MNRISFSNLLFALGSSIAMTLCSAADEPITEPVRVEDSKTSRKSHDWKPMVGSWVACQFGGDGPVEINQSSITTGFGDPLTGVRWEGDVKHENYTIELEARRTDGFDFFCGLTFPVGKEHVTFVLGGWGGGVVGISSIDGNDASQNDTTTYRDFQDNQWYKIRVQVDPQWIRCWIDDKPAAETLREGREFGIRGEMDLCLPLGIAAYQTKAEFRNIVIRDLTAEEVSKAGQTLVEDHPPATAEETE